MIVKGFQLPAPFVSLVHEGGLSPDKWEDRDLVDAYGNRWDGELEVHPMALAMFVVQVDDRAVGLSMRRTPTV